MVCLLDCVDAGSTAAGKSPVICFVVLGAGATWLDGHLSVPSQRGVPPLAGLSGSF